MEFPYYLQVLQQEFLNVQHLRILHARKLHTLNYTLANIANLLLSTPNQSLDYLEITMPTFYNEIPFSYYL